MSADCCCNAERVMILACSGGSNVGQLTNQAAVELTRKGEGKMFCLAGIGGGLSGFIESAKGIPKLLVMDGCPVGCAKAAFAQHGIDLRGYMVLTDLGIEKNKELIPMADDLATVMAAAREILARNDQG